MLPPISPLSELGTFRFLAHHPDCGRHDHHLVRPFGVPLCLGCVGMYSGIVLGGAALLLFRPEWGAWSTYALALAVFAPTFGQPFIQVRAYKLPARVLLGLGFALTAWAVLTPTLARLRLPGLGRAGGARNAAGGRVRPPAAQGGIRMGG